MLSHETEMRWCPSRLRGQTCLRTAQGTLSLPHCLLRSCAYPDFTPYKQCEEQQQCFRRTIILASTLDRQRRPGQNQSKTDALVQPPIARAGHPPPVIVEQSNLELAHAKYLHPRGTPHHSGDIVIDRSPRAICQRVPTAGKSSRSRSGLLLQKKLVSANL